MLCESLADLGQALREKTGALHVRIGVAEEVIEQLIKEVNPTALSYNKDYTPFAQARDKAIDLALAAIDKQFGGLYPSKMPTPKPPSRQAAAETGEHAHTHAVH